MNYNKQLNEIAVHILDCHPDAEPAQVHEAPDWVAHRLETQSLSPLDIARVTEYWGVEQRVEPDTLEGLIALGALAQEEVLKSMTYLRLRAMDQSTN